MAEHQAQVDFVTVRAEDLLAERNGVYGSFLTGTKFAIGATAAILILIYLLWG
jgi:hypothetical protein